MGAKQTKACGPLPPGSAVPGGPLSPRLRRGLLPSRERGGDFLASLVMRSGEKFGKGGGSVASRRSPCKSPERKDLGMESTSLDDVLYRYASFRNLVDPITHDLIISLARYIHCPKPEGDSLGTLEKLCRQLTYHLSPHSQWRRQGSLVKKKPQACLKALLVGNPQDHTVDLSGIPLTSKDLDRVISYLQHSAASIESVELCFTELTDELFLQLLPVLSALPCLSTLSLNGNRLTKAILRDLTEALKDPRNFPSMTWIDLGNNVDIFSLPQPFLVSLKKRCPAQGNLPTILEFGEGQASDLEGPGDLPAEGEEERSDGGPDDDASPHHVRAGEAVEESERENIVPVQPKEASGDPVALRHGPCRQRRHFGFFLFKRQVNTFAPLLDLSK
nr:leucine-rich repeat-containing protein 75A [Pogona vitticeps]